MFSISRSSLTLLRPALQMPGSTFFFSAMSMPSSTFRFSSASAAAPAGKVKITFIDGRKNTKTLCEAAIGKTMLTVGLDNNMEIEAACDGTCACSTCHVYVDEEHFDKLPKASDDEEDMLDLAVERKDNSRLCCQLTVTKECEGLELTLPAEVSNQMS